MSPSRSACPWRILKISSCFLSPLNPCTPSSLATLFSSVMFLSLSSDRFILLPPPPPLSSELWSGGTAVLGGMRLGLRWEMTVSGGLLCTRESCPSRSDRITSLNLSHGPTPCQLHFARRDGRATAGRR